jgi:hypothetical protein
VLKKARDVVKRLSGNNISDAVLIYEAIGPLMVSSSSGEPHFPWVMKLVCLYSRIGPSPADKTLALLEEAYAAMLRIISTLPLLPLFQCPS